MRTVRCFTLYMTSLLAIVFFSAFPALALPSLTQASADTQVKAVVNFQNGRMTLMTQAAPLLPLLEKIAAVADVQIISFSKIPPGYLVTADVKGWPLEKTLLSLLDGKNFMVIYSPGADKRGVKFRGDGPAAESARTGSPPVSLEIISSEGETKDSAPRPGQVADLAAEKIAGTLRIDGRNYSTNELKTNSGRDTGAGRSTGREAIVLAAGRGAGTAEQRNIQRDIDRDVARYIKPSRSFEKPEKEAARVSAKLSREDFLKGQIDMLNENISSGYSDRQFEYWSKIKDPKYIQDDRALLRRYNQELAALGNIAR